MYIFHIRLTQSQRHNIEMSLDRIRVTRSPWRERKSESERRGESERNKKIYVYLFLTCLKFQNCSHQITDLSLNISEMLHWKLQVELPQQDSLTDPQLTASVCVPFTLTRRYFILPVEGGDLIFNDKSSRCFILLDKL